MPKNILIAVVTMLMSAGMTGAASADLVISKKNTANVDCDAGICNATAADAVLNVKDLANMLAASDVKVFAEGPATDITVSAPLRWVSANRLTLGAYGSLNVKAAVAIAGPGGLTIVTNVAGSGGAFRLIGTGEISFWDTASSLVINNAAYTLVNSLPALIAAIAANPSGTYALANGYDARQDGNYPFSPIPTTFTGIFEGLGNTIDNLSIYNSNPVNEDVALFSELGAGGQISDLNLADVSMQVYSGYLAPLVGVNNGKVVHASAGGAISALVGSNWSSAGLVYDNEGTITRSHAAVNMTGNVLGAGGLVAVNQGAISFSSASGSVSSSVYSGGLVAVSAGTITDSYAQGGVTVSSDEDAEAGGLVGIFSGTILRCFATGAVQGGTADPAGKAMSHTAGKLPGISLGGLVGSSNGNIQYAYASGRVTGEGSRQARHSVLGGLVGQAYASSVFQSYALSSVNLNGKKFLGGVIGADDGSSNDAAYWDLDTSGIENPAQGAGNVYDDSGLKGFDDKSFRRAAMRNLDPAVWAEDAKINNGYPYLIANPPPRK